MKHSTALSSDTNERALAHLIRPDGQEDMCFALWMPSEGAERLSSLIFDIVYPRDGERSVHGNVSFTQEYFLRSLAEALKQNSGLAIMHSHPNGRGWQKMSGDDQDAERSHAAQTLGATGLPLVGMTATTDGKWSSRIWSSRVGPRKYRLVWSESVRVVGAKLSISWNPDLRPKPRFKEELRRTISAWGEVTQADIARLRIGIIGLGGAGSIVAESLARMGIQQLTLVDFDRIERLNLDRILHASIKDAKKKRFKVQVISREIKISATADSFEVIPLKYSIIELKGYAAALDCDVLFSCVDRPWPRSVLNFIAYAHLIPVIDGGVHVTVRELNGNITLKSANLGGHIAGPSRKCLACLEQYDPGLVSVERDGLLDDPHYLEGLPKDDVLRRNENVFAFNLGAASLEILQLLSMVVAPYDLADIGSQRYDFTTGALNQSFAKCLPSCPFPELIAKGDRTGMSVTGRQLAAEKRRASK